MTSLEAVIWKPDSRGMPSSGPPRPSTTWRRNRSFMSTARGQVTRRGSRGACWPNCRQLSTSAESRLCAEVMACRSPVKCRLIASAGSIVAAPPPVPPPFIPNTGPRDGSRSASTACRPRARIPMASAMAIVVLPSPEGVGVMAETRISRPVGSRPSRAARSTLARCGPQPMTCSGAIPSSAATSVIGRSSGTVVHAGTRTPVLPTPAVPGVAASGMSVPGGTIVPCPSPPSPARPAAVEGSWQAPREDIGVEQRER